MDVNVNRQCVAHEPAEDISFLMGLLFLICRTLYVDINMYTAVVFLYLLDNYGDKTM